MAVATKFAGANKSLGAAKGTEDYVNAMPVFSNGKCCVSCWQLDASDLGELLAAHGRGEPMRIFVSILSGASQPPVMIGTENNVRRVVADFGPVWKKET